MTLQFGLAFLVIWFLNWSWILYQILKFTPNWKDEEIDHNQIIQNFMTSAPLELIQQLQFISQNNPIIFLLGFALITLGLFL